MIRKTRLPMTDPTAQTRNRSSRRPESALRSANRGILVLTASRARDRVVRLQLGGSPLALVGGDEGRVHAVHPDGAIHDAPADVVATRQVVHHLEQHALE